MTRIRHFAIAPLDVLAQRFIDARIQIRGHILFERALPQRIGTLCGVQGTFGFPLFEAVAVGDGGTVKSVLEVCLRVLTTQEMRAGPHFPECIECLSVVGQVHSFKDLMMPALVRVGAVTPRTRQQFLDAGIPVYEDASVLESMEDGATGDIDFSEAAREFES